MKYLVLLFAIIFSVSAGAIQLTVIGPCSSDPILKKSVSWVHKSLGDLTVSILKDSGLPFQGDSSGIKSISNSPTGDEALEVLSDTQMRAYGWCVTIDGNEPDKMPDEVLLTSSHHSIVWFYAYSLYDRGDWKEYCTPSYKVKSLPICN